MMTRRHFFATEAGSQEHRDAFEILRNDHQVMKNCIQRYYDSQEGEEKIQSALELVRHTSQHSSIEERYLYPLITDKLRKKDVHDHETSAHQVVKQHLDYLDRHRPSDPEQWRMYDASFKLVSEELDEHIKEEEELVFPQLRACMTPQDCVRLGDDLEKGRQTAPVHPHPEGPTKSAYAARMMHPVAAAADKIEDAARG